MAEFRRHVDAWNVTEVNKLVSQFEEVEQQLIDHKCAVTLIMDAHSMVGSVKGWVAHAPAERPKRSTSRSLEERLTILRRKEEKLLGLMAQCQQDIQDLETEGTLLRVTNP